MILSRDDILGSADVEVKEVEVPEWGGTVLVKMMTGKERDDFETSLFKGKGKNRHYDSSNIRAKIAVRCIVDEEGKRIFGDGDIVALGNKSAAALDRVFAVAQDLNKLTEDDIEEMAGNLLPDQSE